MPDAHTVPARITSHCHRSVRQAPAWSTGTILKQRGEMRLSPDARWMPFTAEQRIEATRTVFVWHARCKMAPFITAIVEDAYEAGHGRLNARVWGIFPVAHARGPGVDRGEAQRYLAELAWCPLALTENPDLRFRELSDGSVRVWVHDEQTYADLLFDEDDHIIGAKTSTRPRGTEVQPWHGRFSDYKDFDGILAPSRAEAWWETPSGPFVYWRGEVVSLRWDEQAPRGG